jgi:hypothetical protein
MEIYQVDKYQTTMKGRDLFPIPPSLIDLMSFGWLFLGGLLPSRARLRFTSYMNCATFNSGDQRASARQKEFV